MTSVRRPAGIGQPTWHLAVARDLPLLCSLPRITGIGQPTWHAAVARDLPLLCGLALIITFIVAAIASFGDWIEGAEPI